jgi:hypothetical protein
MIWPGILMLLLLQSIDTAQLADMPLDQGVYYHPDKSSWVRLPPAIFSKANAKGVDMFVYTAGYTDMGMKLTCPGPRAATRIAVPKPVLFVRGADPSKDAMLIRLKKKKDRRTVETAYSNVTVENKGGFRKGDIYRLNPGELPDGSYSLTPDKNLPEGEYLLVFGNAPTAYDFGVDRRLRKIATDFTD